MVQWCSGGNLRAVEAIEHVRHLGMYRDGEDDCGEREQQVHRQRSNQWQRGGAVHPEH